MKVGSFVRSLHFCKLMYKSFIQHWYNVPPFCRGLHKWNTQLCTPLSLHSTSFSMNCSTQGYTGMEKSVYICSCGVVEYYASTRLKFTWMVANSSCLVTDVNGFQTSNKSIPNYAWKLEMLQIICLSCQQIWLAHSGQLQRKHSITSR